MAWKVSDVVNERMKFVLRVNEGERVTDLCREFEISRKTAYKFLERYKRFGAKGLFDESKRPAILARKTQPHIEKLILDTKRDRPTWGAPKLREFIQKRAPDIDLPSRSTIHEILDRHDLVKHRGKRNRYKACPTVLENVVEPNELWCTDFKGQFRMGNQKYCYPLTITDQRSRFLLACEGLERIDQYRCMNIFEMIFREYGLPNAIRSDNGVPFSTRSVQGLSRLSVWWMSLGIKVERTQPGHPEQNGRHERMHRTLKAETTLPPGKSLLQQQEKFNNFLEEFNNERPHEALKMKTPAEIYKPSIKYFPNEIPVPEYPLHDYSRNITECGSVTLKQSKKIFISEALGGKRVGLREEDEGIWRITFMNLDIGFIDETTMKFTPKLNS